MSRRRRDAGMTLVEVLAVLAIVGVTTGATVLGLGALGRGVGGETEAMRLADRLQLAADEAIATSAPLALVWTDRSYEFAAWDPLGSGWHPSRRRELASHVLAAGLRLERPGKRGEAPILIGPDLPGPPVELHVVGGGAGWRVGFDGVRGSAQAMRR
jgi:general secretion pathway protein H